MRIITIEEIRAVLPRIDPFPAIEAAFSSYSTGRAVVGPVGELLFDTPPGDVHIKYGYLQEDDYYVVKVASGFYDNPQLGLASSNGLMLLFDQKTGVGLAVLLDEGYLTDIRTAVAGAVAARYLAPRPVECIGIVGSGTQARLQVDYLYELTGCQRVMVWGRTSEKVEHYRSEMEERGFKVKVAPSAEYLASKCNLIVTTTASKEPLFEADSVVKGTHITAVGSDSPDKQELDPWILKKADLVVADSITQCLERGEIAHAIRAGLIRKDKLVELGSVISGSTKGRSSEDQITVADLTGVAVQDIAITKTVYEALNSQES